MPDIRVDAGGSERLPTLRLVKRLPAGRDQDEAGANEGKAQEVEGTEMWVGSPAEHLLQKVSGVMREPIDARKTAFQPTRQQIDRQRKAVHLGEQRDEESAKGA